MVGHDRFLHGLAEVGPQVIAVSDLDRVRGALACALGKGAGTVATHDLHTRMRDQPRGERGGFTVGEDIDRSTGPHVQQDRRVHMSAAQGEIIATRHPWSGELRLGHSPHQPEQRHPGHRDRHPRGQAKLRAAALILC
jgi:hypothetical protein